tara:strand:+ start:221413 stop:222024 length:612 start_codon:yes stop_codon:yes gene_type:complete
MYFVVDLEATCWERRKARDRNEIIEIGLVVCNDDGESIGSYQSFVKPRFTPRLSSFCKRLTKIDQKWIDEAPPLREVLSFMLGDIENKYEISSQETPWAAFGNWDKKCLQRDCERNDTLFPFGRCIDLKSLYTNFSGCDQCGLRAAVKREKLQWEGKHHRALDDAINAAKLARILVTPEILKLAREEEIYATDEYGMDIIPDD